MAQLRNVESRESGLFFRQWLRSPKSMGAVLPSGRSLGRAIGRAVRWQPGDQVVELGAGTGAITRGLLASGLPADALVVVELDAPLVGYLRDRVPGVRVVHGDATRLAEILGQEARGRIGTVVSGLPMLNMPLDFQRAIIEQSFALLRPGGCIVQYSYSPRTPIRARRLGIHSELAGFVFRNVPPATVWRFTRPNGGNGEGRP